jgi:hypothetical protein
MEKNNVDLYKAQTLAKLKELQETIDQSPAPLAACGLALFNRMRDQLSQKTTHEGTWKDRDLHTWMARIESCSFVESRSLIASEQAFEIARTKAELVYGSKLQLWSERVCRGTGQYGDTYDCETVYHWRTHPK